MKAASKHDSSISVDDELVVTVSSPGHPLQRLQLNRLSAQVLASRLEMLAGPAPKGISVNSRTFCTALATSIKEDRPIRKVRVHRTVRIR